MLAEGFLKGRNNLSDGAFVANALDDRRHHVCAFARGAIERNERASKIAAPCLAELSQTRELIALDAIVDFQDRQRLRVVDEVINADDDAALRFDRLLRGIRGIADRALHEAGLDRR